MLQEAKFVATALLAMALGLLAFVATTITVLLPTGMSMGSNSATTGEKLLAVLPFAVITCVLWLAYRWVGHRASRLLRRV